MSSMRFNVPELHPPTPPQYLEWRSVLVAAAHSIPGFQALFTALIAPVPVGGVPPPYVFPGGAAGRDRANAASALYAHTLGQLRGDVLTSVTQLQVNNIGELVRTLDIEYGNLQVVDLNSEVASFYQDRYIETGTSNLKQWIRGKWSLLLRVPAHIPAPGRNAAMVYALTTLVPDAFSEITNRCRTEVGILWQTIRDRLVDFDKANPVSKREANSKQIRGLNSQVTALQAQVRTLTAAQAASSSSTSSQPPAAPPAGDLGLAASTTTEFRGHCNYCKSWGHRKIDCRKLKAKDGDRVKKDNDKKGDHKGGKGGKGGKGKGKGKKGGK